MRAPVLSTAVLVAALALSGCSSTDPSTAPAHESAASQPSAEAQLKPGKNFPVGSVSPYSVYAHCGVEFVLIDGITWRTKRRGQGNPPSGWPESISGTLTRPTTDQAFFESPEIPVVLEFRPAPSAAVPPCA